MTPDFSRLIAKLTDSGFEFVMIGGYAAVTYGSSQVTRDLDVCAVLTSENIELLRKALADWNPRHRMTPERLSFLQFPKAGDLLRKHGLEPAGNVGTFPHVSTVTEIEHAIERLPDAEVARLAAWLAAYRNRRTSDGNGTHHDLDTLIGSWREDPAFDAAIRAFDQVDTEVWK